MFLFWYWIARCTNKCQQYAKRQRHILHRYFYSLWHFYTLWVNIKSFICMFVIYIYMYHYNINRAGVSDPVFFVQQIYLYDRIYDIIKFKIYSYIYSNVYLILKLSYLPGCQTVSYDVISIYFQCFRLKISGLRLFCFIKSHMIRKHVCNYFELYIL